jgi:5'-3' exonuclease
MVVHLVDGTYELFRHFYGLRRFTKGVDRPYGAVVGVLQTVLQMIENGDRYLGVATDHVIESFRNRLWADYKTGAGIEPALLAQFHPLEEALAAMGVVVWPMIELEADDALASAAHIASKDKKKSSASAHSSFRTYSRSWAMRPTVIPASLGSAPRPLPSF